LLSSKASALPAPMPIATPTAMACAILPIVLG
jgi:hypothetical protein